MTRDREPLPQLSGRPFITDGGLETVLVFHEGVELPHFAAFDLLKSEAGRTRIADYFRTFFDLAARLGAGLILDAPTWRANPDWGERLGYSPRALVQANRDAVDLLEGLRGDAGERGVVTVVSGCIGPRGDGYVPEGAMSASQAEAYHLRQIETFAGTSADMVSAMTMNYVDEAVGIANAARQAGIPVVISFTVETDSRLPTGQSLQAAIEQVDAESDSYASYYMINCAHPSHFDPALAGDEPWLERIRGLRANASRMSHAELDEAEELDVGDPAELGREHAELKRRLPQLNVFGGCCGTDLRHVEEIAGACLPLFRDEG